MNKISDIDVSLSQGQLYNTRHFIVLWFALISSSLLTIVGIVSFVLSCIEWESEIFIVGVLCTLMGIGFLIVSTYCCMKDKKIKKQVVVWLEDAIELKAYAKKIDEHRLGIQPKATKIQIVFTLNNNQYKIESTCKVVGGYEGCVGCFNKYANRAVNVSYSPKYNEVMILRDTI